jgi:GTPase SAR1 family protein
VPSVVSPQSLENVVKVWWPLVKELGKPAILLGNKTDMRDNEEIVARLKAKGLACVTRAQGQATAEQIGALCFFEISCAEKDPLGAVFKEGLLLVFGPQKKKVKNKPTNCVLM